MIGAPKVFLLWKYSGKKIKLCPVFNQNLRHIFLKYANKKGRSYNILPKKFLILNE